MKTIDQTLRELITQTAPGLFDQYGVGADTAGTLLVTAGDNPTDSNQNDRGPTSAE